MKLNYEDKMEIVEMRKKGFPISKICKKIGIDRAGVYKYLSLYRQYGEEVFHRKRFNTEYSPELKLEIIKRFETGESKKFLAVEYKIQVSMLIKWLRNYKEFGYNGLITKKRGRPKMKLENDKTSKESESDIELSSPLTDPERKELIELRARLKHAEMENEFLKKLDTLVQERLKRERKK